jgi:hypothetical protein
MDTLRTVYLLWLAMTLLVMCEQVVLGECGVVSACLVSAARRSVTACFHYLSGGHEDARSMAGYVLAAEGDCTRHLTVERVS